MVSITEGHDKPHKYPVMFSKADVIVLNKTDLLGATNFSRDIFYEQVRALNREADILEVSATQGTNVAKIVHFIEHGIAHKKGHAHDHGDGHGHDHTHHHHGHGHHHHD